MTTWNKAYRDYQKAQKRKRWLDRNYSGLLVCCALGAWVIAALAIWSLSI